MMWFSRTQKHFNLEKHFCMKHFSDCIWHYDYSSRVDKAAPDLWWYFKNSTTFSNKIFTEFSPCIIYPLIVEQTFQFSEDMWDCFKTKLKKTPHDHHFKLVFFLFAPWVPLWWICVLHVINVCYYYYDIYIEMKQSNSSKSQRCALP